MPWIICLPKHVMIRNNVKFSLILKTTNKGGDYREIVHGVRLSHRSHIRRYLLLLYVLVIRMMSESILMITILKNHFIIIKQHPVVGSSSLGI